MTVALEECEAQPDLEEGPDLPPASRELDAALHKLLVGPVLVIGSKIIMDGGVPVPAYTQSLDAITGLCERVLPGWVWRICKCSVSDDLWLMPDFNDPLHGARHKELWPDCRDPLEDGPGLDISFAPSGASALGLCACLISVLDGIQEDEKPRRDASGLKKLNHLAQDRDRRRTIKPSSPSDVLNARLGKIAEFSP